MNYDDPQAAMAEGDTMNFFYMMDVGLRSTENPSYGGWGGRFKKANHDMAMRKYRASMNKDAANLWIDTEDEGNLYKPVYRWTEHFQNDFANRLLWACTDSYEAANHEPVVKVNGPLDYTACIGDEVSFSVSTYDPDGDDVSVKFWQYGAADTYGGNVELIIDGNTCSFVIPDDAVPGEVNADFPTDNIHIIVEATDNGEIPMTRYQRVIVTVVAPAAE